MDATQIVNIVTPIIVPLVLAGVKWILPKIPTWMIPVLAPVLGGLVGIISNAALSAQGNLMVAVALGMAGVGLREIIDQLKPEPKPND